MQHTDAEHPLTPDAARGVLEAARAAGDSFLIGAAERVLADMTSGAAPVAFAGDWMMVAEAMDDDA